MGRKVIPVHVICFFSTRREGLSISETADMLGFSLTIISRVYRKLSKQRNYLVSSRSGQRRMGRLLRPVRKATETQIAIIQKVALHHTHYSAEYS